MVIYDRLLGIKCNIHTRLRRLNDTCWKDIVFSLCLSEHKDFCKSLGKSTGESVEQVLLTQVEKCRVWRLGMAWLLLHGLTVGRINELRKQYAGMLDARHIRATSKPDWAKAPVFTTVLCRAFLKKTRCSAKILANFAAMPLSKIGVIEAKCWSWNCSYATIQIAWSIGYDRQLLQTHCS